MTASASHATISTVPPIGAAIGKRWTPAKESRVMSIPKIAAPRPIASAILPTAPGAVASPRRSATRPTIAAAWIIMISAALANGPPPVTCVASAASATPPAPNRPASIRSSSVRRIPSPHLRT